MEIKNSKAINLSNGTVDTTRVFVGEKEGGGTTSAIDLRQRVCKKGSLCGREGTRHNNCMKKGNLGSRHAPREKGKERMQRNGSKQRGIGWKEAGNKTGGGTFHVGFLTPKK